MKKIFLAAMAAVALFASCEKEPALTLSDNTETLEYKASTFDVEVVTGGNWNLAAAEEYTWISASKTSGMAGDVITFTTQLNVTGKIRTAKFNVLSGDQTQEISINQKSGALDAVLSLTLVNVAQGAAIFDLGIQTSNADDYKEYGVYYATESDVTKAQRKVLGSDVSEGTKNVTLDGLTADTEYFAWPFIVALTGEEVVSETALKVVPPICVDDPAKVQETIDAAAEYSVIRLLGGMVVPGGIEVKSNITVSGGWSQDFSAQNADKTIIEGDLNVAACFVPEGTVGAVIQNLELTKGNIQSVDGRATGGGVRFAGDITIENCYIHHNRAFSRGGGIGTVGDGAPATAVVINTEISHNIAEDSHGAGINIGEGAKLIMVNSLVADNWNQEPGGYAGAVVIYGSCVLVNNTIVNNYQFDSWHTFDIKSGNNGSYLVNNIIVGSKFTNASKCGHGSVEGWTWEQFETIKDKFEADPSPNVVAHPASEGNERVITNNLVEVSIQGVAEGNTIVDKGYDLNLIFADWANYNYALFASSAAVNAGVTTDPVAAEYLAKYAKDLAGNARVAGEKVDLGCYELQ